MAQHRRAAGEGLYDSNAKKKGGEGDFVIALPACKIT